MLFLGIIIRDDDDDDFFCREACRILVPPPGIDPGPPAVKAQNPNHWTTREFPRDDFFNCLYIF